MSLGVRPATSPEVVAIPLSNFAELGNINFSGFIFGSHWLDIFTKSQQGKSNKQGYPLCNYLSYLPLSFQIFLSIGLKSNPSMDLVTHSLML